MASGEKQEIHLKSGEVVHEQVNGLSPDGLRGSVLLVPYGQMSLRERLAESLPIEVEFKDGKWVEI